MGSWGRSFQYAFQMSEEKRKDFVWALEGIVFILLFGSVLSARASTITYSIDVNTSPLSGISAQLAFDLIGGGPAANDNTVILSNFFTDGILGTVSPSGGVTGTLPGTVTLTDPIFFNEYLTNITLGTDFSFQLNPTANGPGLGFLPDAFSLTILDPNTGLPLFNTTDPTGANSLLLLNLDGSPINVYSPVVTATPLTSTPEPSTILLVGSGLSFLWLRRKCKS